MKRIFTFLFALSVLAASANAQVLTYFAPANALVGQNAFMDATTNFDPSAGSNIFGKGMIFPRTDLTQWSFVTDMLDGIFLPTYFDGMIVYNTGTGATPTTGNNPTISTNVTPGFYYFSNPGPVTDYKTGQWKPITSPSVTTAFTQAGGFVSTVNGVTSTVAIPSGTVANLIGYSSTGLPVYQSAATVLTGATTNVLSGASSALTSTVNGVASTLTPVAGTVASTLGFNAAGALVKQATSSLPVTNTTAFTQAGGLVTTVNGVASTTAIALGTVSNVLGYNSTGAPVYQTASAVLTAATTHTLTAATSTITSTVNGVASTVTPAAGTITSTLGFDATGNLVKQSPSALTTSHTLTATSSALTSTVNGVSATITPAAGTTANVLGFDATGALVKQATSSLPVTNTSAFTQAGGLVSTVNGVAATTAIASGTVSNVLGYNSTGAPVYQTASAVLTAATIHTLTAATSTITSTVNGVASTLTPSAGTTANVLGFDATGALVKQATSSLPVTNTTALTQAGGLVTTVNGVASTTAIASGTVSNVLGYSSTGAPVYQTASAVLTAATTNNLTAASNTLTSTVNGVVANLAPADGTIAKSLGFDASGNLVKGSAASSNIYSADGTLTTARTVIQNNLDLTFTTGTAKTIVNGTFKTTGAVYGKPVRVVSTTTFTWADDDVLIKLVPGSGTGNLDLPSASAFPGRIVGINNRSGGLRAFNNTAGGDTGIYANDNIGQLGSAVGMVCFISDGTSWSLYSGRP